MSKIKILAIADGGVFTGFARVSHSIFENLPEDEYEIHHIAINYRGDPFPTKPNHLLYPAMLGGDYIGLGRFQKIYNSIKPDLIWFLNDLWLIKEFVSRMTDEQLGKTVIYFPVDAEGSDFEWLEKFELLGGRVAYTEFGKSQVNKLNPYLNINVIPHGVNTDKFFPVEKDVVWKNLSGLTGDDFIVLAVQRNQPRKRIDLTFDTFAKFSRGKPLNVKLYLHMGVQDEGWNLIKMANRYKIEDRLVLTNTELGPGNGVSIERLNLIYNSGKVGLNTSLGEGWGLGNTEHAVTGAVQVVPNSSACKELFQDCGKLIDIKDTYTYPGTLTIGKVIDTTSAANILNELYESPDLLQDLSYKCYEKFIQPKYQWSNIALEWDKLFKSVLNNKVTYAQELTEQLGNLKLGT